MCDGWGLDRHGTGSLDTCVIRLWECDVRVDVELRS